MLPRQSDYFFAVSQYKSGKFAVGQGWRLGPTSRAQFKSKTEYLKQLGVGVGPRLTLTSLVITDYRLSDTRSARNLKLRHT